MNTLSLEECHDLLQDIREGRRHRLTGSEYKRVVEAVDNHRGDQSDGQLARQVVTMLARQEGPWHKAPFGDPVLNRAFDAAFHPDPVRDRMTGSAHAGGRDVSFAASYPLASGDADPTQRERNRMRRAPRPA